MSPEHSIAPIIAMFRGSPFQVFLHATVFGLGLSVFEGITNGQVFHADPWRTVAGTMIGSYFVAALIAYCRSVVPPKPRDRPKDGEPPKR